jgi:hypothetical protein
MPAPANTFETVMRVNGVCMRVCCEHMVLVLCVCVCVVSVFVSVCECLCCECVCMCVYFCVGACVGLHAVSLAT